MVRLCEPKTIRMVNKNNIAELTIENQDFRIKIKTALASSGVMQVPMMMQQPQMQQVAQTQQITAEKTTQSTSEESKSEAVAAENTMTIKSPIVGTWQRLGIMYYRSNETIQRN